MPRVKNVDCKACNTRVTYEYAVHRKTFLHKLNSAKYAANGDMIYYDSVDLDKSGERVTVQLLREHNKEADLECKKLKAEKRHQNNIIKKEIAKKVNTQHRNFENNRRIAANCNKHLLPKTKPNILQQKLAYEAELVYRDQMASIKPLLHFTPIYDDYDEDLHHFQLNRKTTHPKNAAKINNHSINLLSCKRPSRNATFTKPIKPLANSTQLNYTQSSDSTVETDDIFTNAVVANILKNFSETKSFNYNTVHTNQISDNVIVTDIALQTTNKLMQTSINNALLETKTINISDIPLPENTQPIYNNNTQQVCADISIHNSNVTENISFFTSFYIEPVIPQPTTNYQTNNHIQHISPPMSPISILPANTPQKPFQLHRLYQHSFDYKTNLKCRRCFTDINFQHLLSIADRMPKGRQLFCAPCLLQITSRPADKNVDYYKC